MLWSKGGPYLIFPPYSAKYKVGRYVRRLSQQLAALDEAEVVDDMDQPGWKLHSLKREMDGHWSIKVNGNWRITFLFEDGDAYVVDYQDYH